MFPSVLPTYNRADVAFVRGEGPYLFAEDGKRYLDFGAGIAVNAFGHANPKLVAALTEQANRVWHTSNLYRVPGQEIAVEEAGRQHLRRHGVFHQFRRGSVRVRLQDGAALSLCERPSRALPHHHVHRRVPRPHDGGHRGRRSGEISRRLRPQGAGFDQVPPNDLKALEAAITPATAALMIEPIQGEGGLIADDAGIPARACAASATNTACF